MEMNKIIAIIMAKLYDALRELARSDLEAANINTK